MRRRVLAPQSQDEPILVATTRTGGSSLETIWPTACPRPCPLQISGGGLDVFGFANVVSAIERHPDTGLLWVVLESTSGHRLGTVHELTGQFESRMEIPGGRIGQCVLSLSARVVGFAWGTRTEIRVAAYALSDAADAAPSLLWIVSMARRPSESETPLAGLYRLASCGAHLVFATRVGCKLFAWSDGALEREFQFAPSACSECGIEAIATPLGDAKTSSLFCIRGTCPHCPKMVEVYV